MDTKQSATNLGLSFGVVNCLVVFPTYFNPNKSPLILLQISLLFRSVRINTAFCQYLVHASSNAILINQYFA